MSSYYSRVEIYSVRNSVGNSGFGVGGIADFLTCTVPIKLC